MNHLSYPRKFLLISILFLAPLSLAMYFLLHELGDRIEFTIPMKRSLARITMI
jgi:hypothetical protein